MKTMTTRPMSTTFLDNLIGQFEKQGGLLVGTPEQIKEILVEAFDKGFSSGSAAGYKDGLEDTDNSPFKDDDWK